MSSLQDSLQDISKKIKAYADYPRKGVCFRHIGPLLRDANATETAMKALTSLLGSRVNEVDCIAGVDARGFIIGPYLQMILKKPFVMLRKPSKLPGEKDSADYELEYGKSTLEAEKGAILKGERVLITDDLLATGGTLLAAAALVKKAGAIPFAFLTPLAIEELQGRERILAEYPESIVESLFVYSGDKPEPVRINFFNPGCAIDLVEFKPEKIYLRDVMEQKRAPKKREPVLLWFPTLDSVAEQMMAHSNFTPCIVRWDEFPDGWCNYRFDSEILENADVTVLLDLSIKENILLQLLLLWVLPRQLCRSVSVVVPYFAAATHERVSEEGVLATAEPLMKMISAVLYPTSESGRPVLYFVDIHALQERFYTTENVIVRLTSALPLLKKHFKGERPTIVFPDDGSYKRFNTAFKGYPIIVCAKIRDGDKRVVRINDQLYFPDDEGARRECLQHALIVDDLAQSGGTLIECARELEKFGFEKVSAYVTHSVFPNGAERKIYWDDSKRQFKFHKFITTDSNPVVTDRLKNQKPFEILSVADLILEELSGRLESLTVLDTNEVGDNKADSKFKGYVVFVASTNMMKLEAVSAAFQIKYGSKVRVFGVPGVKSDVSEQPFAELETKQGALNRLENMKKILRSGDTMKRLLRAGETPVFVAIENGIMMALNGDWVDRACVAWDVTLSTGAPQSGFSSRDGVCINKYLDLIQLTENEEGANRTTFGSKLEKRLKVPSGHWHEHIDPQRRNRTQLMTLAVLDVVFGDNQENEG